MFLFLTLSALVFSTGYQMQSKYDFCKEKDFKGEYCEVQKKIFESSK